MADQETKYTPSETAAVPPKDPDLTQLPGRRGYGPTKEEAGLGGRLAAYERFALRVEHTFGIGQQPT